VVEEKKKTKKKKMMMMMMMMGAALIISLFFGLMAVTGDPFQIDVRNVVRRWTFGYYKL
jgi:accessory gene regulator protein AgrB